MKTGSMFAVAVVLLLAACSAIGSYHYYAPESAGGQTSWENPLTEGATNLGGPDNQLTVEASGVTIVLSSNSRGQGVTWFAGPAFLPIVPVFPLWYLLWWMRDELEEHDLTIAVVVRKTAHPLVFDPSQWTIETENGRVIAARSTDPDTLKQEGFKGLTYPTRGTLIETATFTPRFKLEDGSEVVFPVVTLRHSKGTLMTFSP